LGANIGRTPPAEIILADSEVSRAHCRLVLQGENLVVTDLNSTNGAFVDGFRVVGSAVLPVGGILQVGRQRLKHEWRTRREILQSEELDRDLEKANSYVQALLPPPLREGAIRADWFYQPSAKLGGDAFGYGALSDTRFVAYLIDVSGHGAGAAMHSVAVMNLLRQRALPNTNMSKPAQVLAALNAMFQMESHADMYFTMWYGVYDRISRRLDFASAGHHPGYLTPAGRGEAIAMRTRNGLIGANPETTYKADSVIVPAGASIYLFSDGVFEIVTIDGVQWRLQDFLPLILKPPVEGLTECQRLFGEVQSVARPGGLDDDFSLVVLTFD
jgi:serine phosphatase RsbU (regulator of sigma subunit)